MPRIALLHAEDEFAAALAQSVSTIDDRFEIDVLSPPLTRRSRVQRALIRDYDLVQADETLRNGILGAAVSTAKRTPLVVCLRGWADYLNSHGQHDQFTYASIVMRTRAVLCQAERVLCISAATRERMNEYYSLGNDAVVVGRPFHVDRYRNDTERSGDDSALSDILTVTNLRYAEKARGVATVLRGLKPILGSYPELTYQIAGGGRYLPALRNFVSRYPRSDSVNVLGYREDVPELLAAADLFVYVSFLDSFSMAVLEAQAAGLPVIGGDTAGVPEAVGDAGVVCRADPAGVESAVRRVLSSSGLRRDLALQSLQKMETYEMETARRYLNAWNDVLSDHTGERVHT